MKQFTKQRRERRSGCRVWGAVLAASFFMTACAGAGSVAGGGSADGGGQSGAAQEVGSDSLTVGAMVGLTGEFSAFGEDTQRAFEMAAEDIRASGSMPPGAELNLIIVDEGTTENCVREATKFIQVDNVDVLVGQSSNCIVALQGLASTNQVPVVSHQAGTVRLDAIGGEWLWRTYPSDSAEGLASARYFLEEGSETAVTLVQKTESTQGIAKVFAEVFQDGGGEVLKTVEFEGSQASYQAEISSALQTSPDVLFVAAGEETGRTLMREIAQTGFDGRIGVNGDISSDEFVADLGASVMEGVCNNRAAADTESDPYVAFNDEFRQKYGHDSLVSIPNAYDTLMLVTLAGMQGGAFTGPAIRDNLRTVAGPPGQEVTTFREAAELVSSGEEIDYQGASGVLDFDETGTSKVPESTFCVQDGGWTKVREFSIDELGTDG